MSGLGAYSANADDEEEDDYDGPITEEEILKELEENENGGTRCGRQRQSRFPDWTRDISKTKASETPFTTTFYRTNFFTLTFTKYQTMQPLS